MHTPTWLTEEIIKEESTFAVSYDSEFDRFSIWRNGRNIADADLVAGIYVARCMTHARAKDTNISRLIVSLTTGKEKSIEKLEDWLAKSRNLYCFG